MNSGKFSTAGSILAFMYLCGNIFLGLALWNSGNLNFLASLMLLIAFFLSAGFYSYLIYIPVFRPATFSAYLFLTYGFLMPGLYVARTGDFYWPSTALDPDLILEAAFLTLLSILFAILGNFITLRKKRAVYTISTDSRIRARQCLQTSNTQNWALILASLAVVGYISFLIAKFGLPIFIGTRQATSMYADLIGLNSTTFALTKTASQSLALGLLVLSTFLRYRSEIRTQGTKFAVVAALAANLVANNPLLVPRFWLVATLMAVLLCVFYRSFHRHRRSIYAVSPIAMFYLLPTLGSFNRLGTELDLSWNMMSPAELMSHGDLDGFQSMMNVVRLVDIDGLTFGGRIASALLFFVPRSIWNGKYQTTGAEAAEAAGYSFTSISMPLPGELYADGGVFALALGMFLTGWLLRELDSRYRAYLSDITKNQPSSLPMIAVLLAGFAPILLRGSLLAVVSGFLVACGLVVTWRTFTKLRVNL
ncbi:hypothetical protein [Thalassorhabdomicrobium marinisediminis]|uniref:hypothetical protein n=1 Tax=Thalassorhabdomicrobium marinisediminis TaxID=2170577 RepID=UPI002492DF7F|nr:hypothetical protein [Thalassorhabdomicrobium marinisediminis]